jgi:hypothetical protein
VVYDSGAPAPAPDDVPVLDPRSAIAGALVQP